jgi:beta-glucanase (GH16 family)
MTWTRDRIAIGVDDRNYYQFANDGSGRATWPFDHPQYLILNIAIGGGWGGMRGIDDAAFPMRMEVDYVRVYQDAR